MTVEQHPGWQQPSDLEMELGQIGYLRFFGGVALVNAPNSRFAQDLLGEGVVEPTDILAVAEDLMWRGLSDVIRNANSPQSRGGITGLEHNFNDAFPHMVRIINTTYDLHGDRIDNVNHAAYLVRPAPVLHEAIYKGICHARRANIKTSSLMGDIMPALMFREELQTRRLSKVRTR